MLVYLSEGIDEILDVSGNKRLASTRFLQALRKQAACWSKTGRQIRKETYDRANDMMEIYANEAETSFSFEKEVDNKLLIQELKKEFGKEMDWLLDYYSKNKKSGKDASKSNRIRVKMRDYLEKGGGR